MIASQAPEDADLADALDEMGRPAIVTLWLIMEKSKIAAVLEWLLDKRSRRSIPHRMERCGYIIVPNPKRDSDGLWHIDGRRHQIRS